MNRIDAMTPRDRAIALGALTALGIVIVIVIAVLFAVRREAPGSGTAPGEPTPAASAPASPTAEPSPVAILSAPIVAALPPPAVQPEVAVIARPVAPAATRAPATPTPSPDPNVWRVEGVLIDDSTKLPIREVCVVIGPHGCQRGSVRTDSRGVFSFDVPKNPTVLYDLYFVKDGFWTVWIRIKPEGPSVYNLALTKS